MRIRRLYFESVFHSKICTVMKKHLTVFFLSLVTISAISQQVNDKSFQNNNSFQIELGGHGLFYSLNYERIIINGNNFKTATQVGISYYPPSAGMRDVWFPICINEIYSLGSHHIEGGIGYVIIREATRDAENNPDEWFWSGVFTGRIGYRYQKPDGRLVLRAGFTPFMEHGTAHEFHPSGGLSVGYSF
jgi:hypothetical protein